LGAEHRRKVIAKGGFPEKQKIYKQLKILALLGASGLHVRFGTKWHK